MPVTEGKKTAYENERYITQAKTKVESDEYRSERDST